MTDLVKFIKKVKDEYTLGGFEGCWYTRLSGRIFLVFACGYEEEGLKGKIAYNCDDLQCDYDWDWKISNKYRWEEYNCETHSAELIAKWVREAIEPSWLTAYRGFLDNDEEEGEVSDVEINWDKALPILYSTFDVEETGEEIEIQVSYDARMGSYYIELNECEEGFFIKQDLKGFEEDMSCDWQTLYEYFVGEVRSRLED